MKIMVARLLISAVVILFLGWLLPGVSVQNSWKAVLAALILALVNALIRPLLVLLTFPVTLVTLGLFLFVINALMVMLVSNWVPGFRVDGFWWALVFSFLLATLNSLVQGWLLKGQNEESRYFTAQKWIYASGCLPSGKLHTHTTASMLYDRKARTNEELIEIYNQLLFPRLVEEKMLVLLRQGKISKWFSGIGQEAIACGAARAMQPDEWIMPLHRNLGVFTGRGMPLHRLFKQWQGHQDGYSKGRERSFHFGSKAHRICGMISHLGPQLTLANGAALAAKLKGEKKAALAFSGEGGTSEGDFHEALNVAAVWELPVIFLIENNGYGLSTPTSEQFKVDQLSKKAAGYGMEGITIDGNNILTVLDTLQGVREYCIKNQKPYLVECMTFRMRGHEEASGTKYVPPQLLEQWQKKDPVENFAYYLVHTNVMTKQQANATQDRLKQQIDDELLLAAEQVITMPDEQEECRDVYAPTAPFVINHLLSPESLLPEATQHRFIEGIRDGLYQSMQIHKNLLLMGQDIAEYGGAFKVTEGFLIKFGKQRVRNTPLCESAILGAALGLSIEGYKSMVEMQFADFVTMGFNQIVNNLAKIYYRWGQQADTVVRMPTGAGVGAGPFHSQSNEAWFAHVPGLKVVYPSTPADAKGLLIAAINDPNPVMYFEHKALYRGISGLVPAHYYETDIGKARLVQEGEEITIITYGIGVYWALDYQKANPDISLHILDLRTLLPLDYAAIRRAVEKTGKVLVLHEDTLTGGIGAELAAWIAQHCFYLLDAPVMRCASLDTPIPFNTDLEKQFLGNSRLHATIRQLMQY